MSALTELAAFVSTARTRSLPAELTERLQLLVLDTIGCGLLGATLPSTAVLVATIADTESSGAARIWGTPLQVSASNAALVNGASVHAAELDDAGAGGHHGSTTVTVALALAECGSPLSGQQLLAAVDAGVEVGARVADCIGLEPQTQVGFHVPSLVGAFAAAATAAAVLGLDADSTRHALTTVAPAAFGLVATQHGGMGKRLSAGAVAAAGVRAAQLAAHGFEGTDEVFDGWSRAVSGGAPKDCTEQLAAGLGVEHLALQTSIKLWGARLPIHAALEAMAELHGKYGFSVADVDRVTVTLSVAAHQAVGGPYDAASPVAAQMSVRYCLAALLVHGDVFFEQFDDAHLTNPNVGALIERIETAADASVEGGMTAPASVDVVLCDGRRLSASGSQRRAGAADVHAKFAKTAAALPDDRRAAIADACDRLPALLSVTELTRLLAA